MPKTATRTLTVYGRHAAETLRHIHSVEVELLEAQATSPAHATGPTVPFAVPKLLVRWSPDC
jgi:hypothetical protein